MVIKQLTPAGEMHRRCYQATSTCSSIYGVFPVVCAIILKVSTNKWQPCRMSCEITASVLPCEAHTCVAAVNMSVRAFLNVAANLGLAMGASSSASIVTSLHKLVPLSKVGTYSSNDNSYWLLVAYWPVTG